MHGLLAGAVFLAATVACCRTCYSTARTAYRQAIDQQLSSYARVLAGTVDAAEHARWGRPEDRGDRGYILAVEKLRAVVRATRSLRYAYTLRPAADGPRFVLDSGAAADTDSDGVIDQAAPGELYGDADPIFARAAATGETLVTPEPFADRWGRFISAYTPIRSADGRIEAILGVDMDATEFLAHLGAMRASFVMACLEAALASLCVGVVVASYQRSRHGYLRRIAESERRYILALDGSCDGLWDWDIATDTVYVAGRLWSPGGCGDPSGGRMDLDRFLAGVYAEDRERVRRVLSAHLSEGATYDLEYRLAPGEGPVRWVHARGQASRDRDGTPVRMAGSVRDVTDRVRLRRALHRAARRDRLTGLPNRPALLRRLRKALGRSDADGTGYALLFLDFDRFKAINDELGHEAGDQLLVAIASRLRRGLRRDDRVARAVAPRTAARFGGDEFVILLERLSGPAEAIGVAERLLRLLAEPYAIAGRRIVSTASIGIAMGPRHYRRADDVLRDADAAMYRAKSQGRGRYELAGETIRPGPDTPA